jgi:hypothetical protein
MKIKLLRAGLSNGLNALATKLKERGHEVKKIKLEGSLYRGHPSHRVINWGRSDRGAIRSTVPILNNPESILIASDKVKTLETLRDAGLGQNLPRFTTDYEEAKAFMTEDLEVVYSRTLTRASQGRGIEIACTVSELVRAPLYTCLVDVAREVRVHVVGGRVIDYAQKRKMGAERRELEGIEEVNLDVRSHDNGWVFAREGISINDIVKQVAIQSVSALGLDFGAVDIIITPQGVPKVLEINTAPGLEGTTLESYALAIEQLCLN